MTSTATDPYERQLDEHIEFLQKQLDDAAAFRHKREQYMHGKPLNELMTKWNPMVAHIKTQKLQEGCAMHLEYAEHFMAEHKIDRWKSVLMPAIAAWYADQEKK
jgi:hypothetical protein